MSMHIEGKDWEEGPQHVASGRSGPGVGLIAFVVVAALAAVFVLQNRERTEIDFLVFELRSRTWVAIAVSIALGVLLDRLFLMFWRRRKARRQRHD